MYTRTSKYILIPLM